MRKGGEDMKNLAVIFPGIGYTADKPLLYYAGKLAKAHGYETVTVTYSAFPKKVKGDRAKMEESYRIVMNAAEKTLKDLDLSGCGDIVFIGKSIGTVAAAKFASESPWRERIRLVLYTPLEETFSYDFGEAVSFTGGADPWVGEEKGRISRICEERDIPCMLVTGANHSLETGDTGRDLACLCRVMQETEHFLRKAENGGDRRGRS